VQTDDQKRAAQTALSDFNTLIGGWRGIGQPRRGSNRGAWQQKAEWVWDFQPDEVSIRYDVKDGKLTTSARVSWDEQGDRFRLVLTSPEDDQQRTYIGRKEGNKFVFESAPGEEDVAHRLTITMLNEKRTLVLHEARKAKQQSYFRIAEVGYTREGTRLATAGAGGPECVVTGGLGTIQVSHKGKTYYVCCSGCKQAFDDDPEGILADFAVRKQKEAAKDR
jgi:hypothetical protein